MRGGAVPVPDPYDATLEELIHAIELRECGDPDGADWATPARIRDLERRLLEEYRMRPGRWRSETAGTRELAAAGASR
jgi:hypothetical protein